MPCPGRHLVIPITHFLGCSQCTRGAQGKHGGCFFHSWFSIGVLADVSSSAALPCSLQVLGGLRQLLVRCPQQGNPGSGTWSSSLGRAFCTQESRGRRSWFNIFLIHGSTYGVVWKAAKCLQECLSPQDALQQCGGEIRGDPSPTRAAQPGQGRGESWQHKESSASPGGRCGSVVPARILAGCSLGGSSCWVLVAHGTKAPQSMVWHSRSCWRWGKGP